MMATNAFLDKNDDNNRTVEPEGKTHEAQEFVKF